ncbi:MAG TPA: YgjP-like metallopeptidase domain-containing protein [Candidatus Izemoplasmatales bacterium]|nr:YgjP-like metallopeptidase domain-containing protein [Candidatus Izemoplasmatales bacterium]
MKTIKLDNYTFNYQVFFKNNKHLYLRIKNDMIIVTSPRNYRVNNIEVFIKKHKYWIIQHMKQNEKPLYDYNQMSIWGKVYKMMLVPKLNKQIVFDGKIIQYSSPISTKQIEWFYQNILQNKIKNILYENHHILSIYFDMSNVVYKTQLMRSRLGSCIKHKRIIKINSLLSRFDPKYLRLVLFHEISHLLVQNHSRKFHDLLERIYPNHKRVQKELNIMVRQYHF